MRYTFYICRDVCAKKPDLKEGTKVRDAGRRGRAGIMWEGGTACVGKRGEHRKEKEDIRRGKRFEKSWI